MNQLTKLDKWWEEVREQNEEWEVPDDDETDVDV